MRTSVRLTRCVAHPFSGLISTTTRTTRSWSCKRHPFSSSQPPLSLTYVRPVSRFIQQRRMFTSQRHFLTSSGELSPKNFKTEAYVVQGPKAPFELKTIYLDEVRDDELLIEMRYSGICHTDIVLQQGLFPTARFPAVFGHEGAGVVKALGAGVKNKDLKVGDSVLLSFNNCGHCRPCLSGRLSACRSHSKVNHYGVRGSDSSTPGTLEDGSPVYSQYFGQSSFARHSVVNEKCAVKCDYPEQMNIYAPIGCGFQTGAGTILNSLKPSRDDVVVIFGLGGVGLACVMAAKYLGVGRIIVADVVSEKLQLAKEMGATDLVNPKDYKDIAAYLKEITEDGVTHAIDCTGLTQVVEQCLRTVGLGGIVGGIGVPSPSSKVEIDALDFQLSGKQYTAVIMGQSNPQVFIPQLVAMHREGHFPIDKLCKTYPAKDLHIALEDMKAGRVIKPVISWLE